MEVNGVAHNLTVISSSDTDIVTDRISQEFKLVTKIASVAESNKTRPRRTRVKRARKENNI